MALSTKRKFFQNTAIVSIFTMVSRIFGYIRDAAIFIFISNSYGALDAFILTVLVEKLETIGINAKNQIKIDDFVKPLGSESKRMKLDP